MFSTKQFERLLRNGHNAEQGLIDKMDNFPVVLLRLSGVSPKAWLLASVNPSDQNQSFGLISEANEDPSPGYVNLSGIKALASDQELKLYQDPLFESADRRSLAEYHRDSIGEGQKILQFTEQVDHEELRDWIEDS
ncbi:MAG: DUF2958 domain-containing protein [Pseudomonadota bacterium]